MASAWNMPPHVLFEYDDDLLATMVAVLEDRAEETKRHG